MAEVEFLFNGTQTLIQCNKDDKFIDILSKFLDKTKLNPDSLCFLYSGKLIENKEQTFAELANNADKERNKMVITINESEKIDDREKEPIIKPKYIICPRCKENCCISFKDYRIRFYNCINEHVIEGIGLEEYESTQSLDESKIICDDCKTNNKSNSYNNTFYRCNTCKFNLCPLCFNKHEKTHNIIDYEDKNYICPNHNYPYSLYCKSCKKNLCITCEMEHNNNINTDNHPKSEEKKEEKPEEIELKKNNLDEELVNINQKMEEARNTINNLSKKSIAALKALNRETENTRTPLRLAAIIYYKVALKKIKVKCEWEDVKNAISKENFIDTIKNAKPEDLGDKVVNIIEKEIKDPMNHWNIGRIKSAFTEVGILAEFVESLITVAKLSNKSHQSSKKLEELKDKKSDNSNEIKKVEHEIISFGKIMQTKETLLSKSNNYKEIKEVFISNIKDIIHKLNQVIKNVELLYKINEDIFQNEPKKINYEIIQNLNENNIDYCFKNLEEINKEKDLTNKLKSIMKIYDSIENKDDEIRIIYKIDEGKDKIKILNENFVKNNKDKGKIIYENKEFELKEFFDVKTIKAEKVEIKLKGIKNIDFKEMLDECPSFHSITKWNKDIQSI